MDFLLDTDWFTEGVVKNEEAHSLDAACYGNVARFVIPVGLDTPDRHCYHLALFARRKLDALEELTWNRKQEIFL